MTDDKKARVDQMSAVLLLAFAAAGGTAPVTIVRPVAEALDELGVRVGDDVDEDVLTAKLSEIPGFQKERMREEAEAAEVQPQPDHTTPQESRLIRRAPKMPKKIPAKLRGTITHG
ncbi:hypothetical protein [Gordonia tangerina]|uniref:Uncharacterized protein n=1 Tax=Gordonia tangerina TaxID=2911060 RepID=A0ABS9DQ14_9ACTN|nr:hypothetical protein [Gordonia tangerina]MCF3941314.1 hypothetical protein [Gordonia tangerina]